MFLVLRMDFQTDWTHSPPARQVIFPLFHYTPPSMETGIGAGLAGPFHGMKGGYFSAEGLWLIE